MANTYFHFIHGASELLVNEQRLNLLEKARRHGFNQTDRITIEPSFNWQQLISNCQMQDLWSDKKIIDINNHINKLDRQATPALQELCDASDSQLLVIVCCSKLTAAQTKAKWYQKLSQSGQCHAIRSPGAAEYPQWLMQRAQKNKLTLNKEVAEKLAQLTQGNLLAGHQALQKAQLLDLNTITEESLSNIVNNCAQYQVFDLADTLLRQDGPQCLRILSALKQQNTESVLVLWSLAQTCRQLYQMSCSWQQGQSLQQATSKQWASKRQLYQNALQRVPRRTLSTLLKQCHLIDTVIKSSQSAQCWQLFDQLCLLFCNPKATTA